MRFLFFLASALAGIFAALWWTGTSPSDIADLTLYRSATQGTVTEATRHADSAAAITSPLEPLAVESSPGGSGQNNDTTPVAAQSPPLSYHEGVMRVAPAVVSVYAANRGTNAQVTQNLSSQGSGVIVAANGIVLTNLHLLQGFENITVVLNDGRSYPAELIGSDMETDLAVVQIGAKVLPFLKLDEAEPLKVGDIVLAIGNPFGVGQTVTQGIVSATSRRLANASALQNFVQIDAAINPGNSGGALINPLGQLVGVNTAVFRGESGAVGIGYAIPADLLAQVVPQIIEHGSVSRGWLGLGVEDINMFPALYQLTQFGAVITAVEENGPAFKTGVRPRDIVVQIGEQPIRSATQLLLAVSALPPGATVKIALLRNPDPEALSGENNAQALLPMIFKVKLGQRPSVSQLIPPSLAQ